MLAPPINIPQWLKENEHLLQPPVNNYCLHRGGFTVMVSMHKDTIKWLINQLDRWWSK